MASCWSSRQARKDGLGDFFWKNVKLIIILKPSSLILLRTSSSEPLRWRLVIIASSLALPARHLPRNAHHRRDIRQGTRGETTKGAQTQQQEKEKMPAWKAAVCFLAAFHPL
jgi:hypothetical protein